MMVVAIQARVRTAIMTAYVTQMVQTARVVIRWLAAAVSVATIINHAATVLIALILTRVARMVPAVCAAFQRLRAQQIQIVAPEVV